MYKSVESKTDIEGESCKEYGIQIDGGISILGISTEEQEVWGLIADLNELAVEPCHLMDIVEDWLDERYSA